MDEKMMDEKESEYMNYALTVIKDKAYELYNFAQSVIIKNNEDMDPVKLTMEFEPLQQALNSALDQFYRRYPERKIPHYINYRPTRVNDYE